MYKQHRNQGIRAAALVLAVTMTLVWVAPGFAGASGWGKEKDSGKFLDKAKKNLEKQFDLRFEDLEDAVWAIGAIAKMKGLGIINGYAGNVFRPNSAVKQAEALAMIARALDMEDKAQEYAERFGGAYAKLGYEDDDDLDFDIDDLEDAGEVEETLKKLGKRLEERSTKVNGHCLPFVPSGTRWALGYILLAVDQGWVKISEVSPNAAASRAWVSMVMVRALGKEKAAQDRMDSVLPYKDFNSIPKGMVGYVAVGVAIGLFEGYPDGTFRPNKSVTRAEMATIISRYLSEELPDETPFTVKGTITAVGSSKITVKAESGRSFTYAISADALVLINNKPASVSRLEVGDKVEVLSNGEGVALLITVKEQLPDFTTVTGEIVSRSTPASITIRTEDDALKSIALASDCKITFGTATLTFGDLRVGDAVKVTVRNKIAVAVKVTSRDVKDEVVSGVIKQITRTTSGTDIVINKVYGEATLRLDKYVEIAYKSSSLSPEDLRIGDKVDATIRNQKVVKILITARDQSTEFGNAGGTIVSISQSGSEYTVTVQDKDALKTFAVASNCVVTHGEIPLSRSGLKLGDKIRAKLNSDGVAVEIRIYFRTT